MECGRRENKAVVGFLAGMHKFQNEKTAKKQNSRASSDKKMRENETVREKGTNIVTEKRKKFDTLEHLHIKQANQGEKEIVL